MSFVKFLRWLLGLKAKPEVKFMWRRERIGPVFEWLDDKTIRILEGPLNGKELGITTEILDTKANIFASLDGHQIGRTYIERDPPGKGIVLWDIAVQEEYRQMGIASLMTYFIFRELLSAQKEAFFKIRMMKLMKPTVKSVELQNIGIGVIGNRLGFTPEFDIERILKPSNIVNVSVLPAAHGFPPSYKIVVKTFPMVLIAFVLDQDTLKPICDFHTYVKLLKDERVIYEWVKRGSMVIGNGNYLLKREGINRFINHMASNQVEAKAFQRRVKPAVASEF